MTATGGPQQLTFIGDIDRRSGRVMISREALQFLRDLWRRTGGDVDDVDAAALTADWPTVTSKDYIDNTIDGTGQLAEGVVTDDSSNYQVISNGLAVGSARDGDSVTFDVPYGVTPVVRWTSGGVSYNASLTGDQTQAFEAVGLSGTGFTASLKNEELAGATTPVTESPSVVGSGVDRSINKATAAEAWDDKYTFQYDAFVDAFDDPEVGESSGYLQIGFYTNDGGGWVLRATRALTGINTTYTNLTKTVTVDGLGLNDDFGMSILSDLGGESTITFDQVDYETASSPTSESATPSGAPDVEYIVLGGQ